MSGPLHYGKQLQAVDKQAAELRARIERARPARPNSVELQMARDLEALEREIAEAESGDRC